MAVTPFDQLANGASTVLRLPHVAGDGKLSVLSTAGFVAPTRVTCYTGTGPLSEKRLCILAVTAVNPTTRELAVSGAVEGTADVNLKVGVRVEIRGTAGQYNQLTAAINAIETTSSHMLDRIVGGVTDAEAPNNSLFLGSDHGGLPCWKDGAGVVSPLSFAPSASATPFLFEDGSPFLFEDGSPFDV